MVGRRAAAAFALTAILACSGLGLCWQQFTSAHDCCSESLALSDPARACDSTTEGATTATVAYAQVPPIASTAVHSVTVETTTATQGAALPPKAPPLVLRI